MKSTSRKSIVIVAVLLLLIPSTVFAIVDKDPPEPTYLEDNEYTLMAVDGQDSDWYLPAGWDMANDLFAYMHQAAKPDKPVLAEVYLRYSCTNGRLYAFVKPAAGLTIWDNGSAPQEHWIKIDGKNVVNEDSPVSPGDTAEFAWGNVVGTNAYDGWEASYELGAPIGVTEYGLAVHTLVYFGGGAQTAQTDTSSILRIECGEPTAVDLTAFGASAQANAIQLNWATASEADTLGFNVYRSESPLGQRVQLNASLIPAQAPGSPVGASYSFVDESVTAGITYYYWLEDVDVYGAASVHGPVSAQVAGLHRLLPARPRPSPSPTILGIR